MFVCVSVCLSVCVCVCVCVCVYFKENLDLLNSLFTNRCFLINLSVNFKVIQFTVTTIYHESTICSQLFIRRYW